MKYTIENDISDIEIGTIHDVETIHTPNGETDEVSTIPANLVTFTNMIVSIHRANGDLAWLSDIVRDAEKDRVMNNYDVNDYLP